jgi:KDO2-lipid IV(A) lauroyltransferase
MKRQPKVLSPGKRFRHRLEVVAVHALSRLVRCLPRTTVRKLGRGLGWLAYCLGSETRRVCRANLDIAFGDLKPPAEKQQIARRSVQSAVATLLCLLWAPRLTRETIGQYLEADPAVLAWLGRVRARGKGIIFATLHYGDWELVGLGMSFCGFPMTIVQEAMRNEALGQFLARLRAHSGNRIVSHRAASLRLLKALRRGENVAMLMDLNAAPRSGGVWLDFFGLPVFNNSSVAALALRTGAPIVFGVAVPQPDGRTKLVCGPEIPCEPTGDPDADLRAVSQACLTCCENLIRRQPEHWLWAYKRWGLRPSADPGRYPFYARHLPALGSSIP